MNRGYLTNEDVLAPPYLTAPPNAWSGSATASNWIYTVLKIFSPFTIWEQLALALKIFTVLNTLCTIQDFKQLCACPEKQSCLAFTVLNIFFTFRIWATCACPEIQSVPWYFTELSILFTFRIFQQLALALKLRGPPASYAYVWAEQY